MNVETAQWFKMSLMAFRLRSFSVLATLSTTGARASGSNAASFRLILRAVQDSLHRLDSWIRSILESAYKRIIRGQFGVWDMVALFAACGLVQAYKVWRQQTRDDRTRQTSARGSCDKHHTSVDYKSRCVESRKSCYA